jgi:tripartite-type tricarboxylate transporter receptor subunit TctC
VGEHDRARRRFIAGGMAAAVLPRWARADAYPSKPIRLIASVPAGIGSDRYARLFAQKLGEPLKQPVVVENRPGAGGMIAAEVVAKAPADGYTLLWGQNALFGTAPHVMKNDNLDVIKTFVGVAGNALSYPYLYASPAFPIDSYADLVARAKQKPGALNYGSMGVGSGPHIAMELLKHQAGLDMQHVPLRGGSAEVLRALVAGDIAVAFEYYMPLMAQVKAGRIKVIGLASRIRAASTSSVPTLDEQGLKGFEYFGWSGIFTRAGTPQAIVDRLNAEIAKARASPEVQKLYREAGSIELKGSAAQFGAFVRSEYERGRSLVEISGATIQ